MDNNQMMLDLLKTYGAAPTPRNIAQAQQFFASNPDQMERRAMGMRGSGVDDNTDLLGPMLDKLMAAIAGPSTPAPAPVQAVQQPPMQQPAPMPQRAAPSAPPVQTQGLQYNPNQNLGPLPAKNGAAPMDMGTVEAVSGAQSGMPGGGGSGSKDWLLPMLTALLGASSTAGRAVMGGRGSTVPEMIAPDGKWTQEPQLPTTQGPREVIPATRGVGGAAQAALTDNSKPPIVPIPEVGDSTAKKGLTAPPGKLNAPPQKQIEGPDYKARTQAEYDSANDEMDKYESATKKERAAQIRAEKAAKALKNVKK